jgi:hypothetical protein
MFSKGLNDTSIVIRMMIVGHATTWSITFDYSGGAIYDCNVFIVQATGCSNKGQGTSPEIREQRNKTFF